MKYLIILISIFFGIHGIHCTQVLPVEQQTIHLIDSLPTNFSYQVDTDSFPQLHFKRDMPPITYFQNEMTIGCYQPVQIKPLFSITIGHQFLFEAIDEYSLFINKKKTSNFKLILYAVKKEHSEKDSLLINAIEDYCIYGQSNYIIQSDDYILFTYVSSNASSVVRNLHKMGMGRLIEERLIKNLNDGASFETKTQLPNPINNPYHKKAFIKGEFLWQSGGMPALATKTPDNEIHVSGLPHTSHSYLRLGKNNKALLIKNYNLPKSNHDKYKCRWFMDNTYIYVYESSFNRWETYRTHNENVLMHISEKTWIYSYVRLIG